MPGNEFREYNIGGEMSPEAWATLLQYLGGLGVSASPVAPENPTDEAAATDTQAETLSAGTIPYTLEEITSPEQYLGNEHIGEFWPEYRTTIPKELATTYSRHDTLGWGINMLAHPMPKRTRSRDPARDAIYAEALGIKIVEPRSRVGFSDTYAPGTSDLWSDAEFGGAVIEVGSFIESVRRIAAGADLLQAPYGVTKPALRFFLALADKLEAQLLTSSTEIES